VWLIGRRGRTLDPGQRAFTPEAIEHERVYHQGPGPH
jgi:hypothetical protein